MNLPYGLKQINMKQKNLYKVLILVVTLIMTSCMGNKTGQSASESASADNMTVDEVVQEAIATADKEIPNTSNSIVGNIPALLIRRETAFAYVNDWMSKNQVAVAKEEDALDKSLAFVAARDEAFEKVMEHYSQSINVEAEKLAGKGIPLELDSRYFTSGTAKIREIGESLVYFSYDLKAVEDRRGYYRVVVQYLDESGNVLSQTEALSANITTTDEGPVCRFDQSATVTDLDAARQLKVTLRTEDD